MVVQTKAPPIRVVTYKPGPNGGEGTRRRMVCSPEGEPLYIKRLRAHEPTLLVGPEIDAFEKDIAVGGFEELPISDQQKDWLIERLGDRAVNERIEALQADVAALRQQSNQAEDHEDD